MNKRMVHNMVEYINQQPDFPFDCIDVEESVEQVMVFFGFAPETGPEERQEVKRELLKKARAAEMAEIARLVEMGTDCELTPIMDKLRPYRRGRREESSTDAGEFVQRMRQQ